MGGAGGGAGEQLINTRTEMNLPHEFKGYTEVIPEVEILNHVDDVVLVVSVLVM